MGSSIARESSLQMMKMSSDDEYVVRMLRSSVKGQLAGSSDLRTSLLYITFVFDVIIKNQMLLMALQKASLFC